MKPRLIAAVAILAAALIFALLNWQRVRVSFLVGEFHSSVAALIVLVFGFGLLTGWLLGTMRKRGRNR